MKIVHREDVSGFIMSKGTKGARTECGRMLLDLAGKLELHQCIEIDKKEWVNKTSPQVGKGIFGVREFTTRTKVGNTGWVIFRVK